MKNKKYCVILVCLLVEVSMLWGYGMHDLYINPNMEKIEKGKAEQILEAIKNKDKKGLRSLFVPEIEDLSPTYNEDVKALFEKYEMQSYEIISIAVCPATSSFGDGNIFVRWETFCDIEIDDGFYSLIFIDIKKDTKNKKNIGLYAIELVEREKVRKIGITVDDMEAGVFNLERYMKNHKE
jgi:hypothetical protein